MEGRQATWLELCADLLAAVALAAAAAFSAARFQPSYVLAGALGCAAMLGAFRLLRSVEAETPSFALPEFPAAPFPEAERTEELLLTEADRLEPATAPDELLLDDVLERLEDFSRVVRLFDRAAMPTPGELKTRIDRHFAGSSPAGPPDASQALHDALSELRRTLR